MVRSYPVHEIPRFLADLLLQSGLLGNIMTMEQIAALDETPGRLAIVASPLSRLENVS